jgi:hypothetical protein
MLLKKFKKNPLKMLPSTEEEINRKYNFKNLNFDEFLDYFEKEVFLSD